MTEPVGKMALRGDVPKGFPTGQSLSKILERPIGLGIWVGIVMGSLNALMFSWPMLSTMIIYGSLGGLVCALGCPEMRTTLRKRRARIHDQRVAMESRSRSIGVFTAFE